MKAPAPTNQDRGRAAAMNSAIGLDQSRTLAMAGA